MSDTADTLPEGWPFFIGEAFVAALRESPALAGATVLDNPVRLSDLTDGERIVFFEDVSDGPAQQDEGGKRVYRYNVGVVNRTEAARRGAHGDYRAAKRAVKAALPRLKPKGLIVNFHREGEIAFRLENIDVGGGLVLGTFTIGYRDPS